MGHFSRKPISTALLATFELPGAHQIFQICILTALLAVLHLPDARHFFISPPPKPTHKVGCTSPPFSQPAW
jgi:hypothetical protein